MALHRLPLEDTEGGRGAELLTLKLDHLDNTIRPRRDGGNFELVASTTD